MDLSIARKILLAVYPLRCCPYCGARLIESKDNKCSACGSEVSEQFIRDLARVYVERVLYGTGVSVDEAAATMRKVSVWDIGRRFTIVVDSIEKKIFARYRERILEAKKSGDTDKMREIANEIRRIKENIIKKLQEIQYAQIRAASTNKIEDLEKAYKLFEAFKRELAQYIDPESLGAYMIPEFTLKVADKLYRASRFNDAMKWYGATLTSNLFPESPPKGGLPLYVTATYIPFGSIFLESYDVDYDGINELFYVPSREIGGLEIPCAVINESGITWSPLGGYNILLPRFGDFGRYHMIIFAWESQRLVDAKVLGPNGDEIRIISDGDTYYSLPIISAKIFDVDGDGFHEILAAGIRGQFYLLKFDGETIRLRNIAIGNMVDYSYARFSFGGRIIILTYDGRLLEINPETCDIRLILSGVENPDYAVLNVGDFDNDGSDEIYVNTLTGVLRVHYSGEKFLWTKFYDGNALGCFAFDVDQDSVNEIIIAELKERGVSMHVHKLKEFLGDKTLEKEKSYYVELIGGGMLKRAKIDYGNVFMSRPNFLVSDIDGDGSPEVFIGLDRFFVSLDFKYAEG